jgi:hypothetical protein
MTAEELEKIEARVTPSIQSWKFGSAKSGQLQMIFNLPSQFLLFLQKSRFFVVGVLTH